MVLPVLLQLDKSSLVDVDVSENARPHAKSTTWPNMTTTYKEAIAIIENEGVQRCLECATDAEILPLSKAVGRICRQTYSSTISTPTSDTSAENGFAINSGHTQLASPSNPVIFCVKDMVDAGDAPRGFMWNRENDIPRCIKITTGALFPDQDDSIEFDSCIKSEDALVVPGPNPNEKYIHIFKPVARYQNRLFAGSDFRTGDDILHRGMAVQPHHIMACSALGITEISVFRKLVVGILSTSSELALLEQSFEGNGEPQIRESNRPYIEAVLSGLGVEVIDLGTAKGDAVGFEVRLSTRLMDRQPDVIILISAASSIKFDLADAVINKFGAKACFHEVGITPGHSALFSSLHTFRIEGRPGTGNITPPISPIRENQSIEHPKSAFFSLPGDPVALAVCLRFLVIPYLRALYSMQPVKAKRFAKLKCSGGLSLDMVKQRKVRKPKLLQAFWYGKLNSQGREVKISADQSSHNIRPLLESNCWIGISAGQGSVGDGDEVEVFEMYPQSLGK